MITYAQIETRLGRMWAVATERGLARLVLPGVAGGELADTLPRGDDARHDPAALQDVAAAVTAFLDGEPAPLLALPLDLAGVGGFRRDVLEAMRGIPRGRVATYSELAAAAGRPRAVRAAGTGCATNPLPLVIPCHRVVRSDLSLGNYGGGAAMKADLLRLEGVAVGGTPPRVSAGDTPEGRPRTPATSNVRGWPPGT